MHLVSPTRHTWELMARPREEEEKEAFLGTPSFPPCFTVPAN